MFIVTHLHSVLSIHKLVWNLNRRYIAASFYVDSHLTKFALKWTSLNFIVIRVLFRLYKVIPNSYKVDVFELLHSHSNLNAALTLARDCLHHIRGTFYIRMQKHFTFNNLNFISCTLRAELRT